MPLFLRVLGRAVEGEWVLVLLSWVLLRFTQATPVSGISLQKLNFGGFFILLHGHALKLL